MRRGGSPYEVTSGSRILTTMSPRGSTVIQRWPPHSATSSCRVPRSTLVWTATLLRARAGFIVVKLQESVRSGGAPAFRHRNESVGTEADVGMLGREVSVHHDRAELDLQPPARRHAFASVGSQVHEEPFHAFGSGIHVQWSGSRRKLHFHGVAGDTLQDRSNIADDRSQLDHRRPATLFVAVGCELAQEPGCTRNFFEQHFAVLSGSGVAAVRHQPLLHVLVDTAEQAAACDGHFGGKPADGFHPMRLAQPVLEHANGREIFDAALDEIGGGGAGGQTHQETATVLSAPCGLGRLFPFEPRHRSMSQDRSFGDSKTAAAKSAPRSSSAERRPTKNRQHAIRMCRARRLSCIGTSPAAPAGTADDCPLDSD